jgi:hypothetical protein
LDWKAGRATVAGAVFRPITRVSIDEKNSASAFEAPSDIMRKSTAPFAARDITVNPDGRSEDNLAHD